MSILRKLLLRLRRFNASGAAAVEFAIVGPLIFLLMFWFIDAAFSLYVRNSFNHAVNTVAREIYVDPDKTASQIKTELEAELTRFGDTVVTSISTETVDDRDYNVIEAQMDYTFKAPLLNNVTITLKATGRAPVVKYQL